MEGVVIAALCGIGVGILSGMFGIGGGTIMVPIFRLGFGLSALQATGTSLFTMIFTSAAGSVTHVRNHTCIVPLGLLAGLCGAVFSPLGVRLANLSPSWLVMLATALVIAYSSLTMLRKGLSLPKGGSRAAQGKAGVAGTVDAAAITDTAAAVEAVNASDAADTSELVSRLTRRQYAIGALAGMAAGLAGGYIGLGGGFLMVPIFLAFVGLPMKQASGTSLLAVSILAAAGSAAQAYYGNLEMLAGFAMALGSIPGAVIGANLVQRIPERNLRILFGIFMLVIAAILAINEVVAS